MRFAASRALIMLHHPDGALQCSFRPQLVHYIFNVNCPTHMGMTKEIS
ncbi:hypothetical protein ABIE32_002496 [Comamonas sp. 4034]